MEEISQLISNVGFPIVACIFMYKQNVKLTDNISNLNNTLQKIDTRIDNLEKKGE